MYTLIGSEERESERKCADEEKEYEVDAIRKIFGVEKVIKTPFEINFRDAFSEHEELCAVYLYIICSVRSMKEESEPRENAKTTGR